MVLLIFVGSVPDNACIKRSLLPGVNPLLFHSQLLLWVYCNAVTRDLPLCCLCIRSSNLLNNSFFLLVTVNKFNLTILSSFMGVNLTTAYLAMGSADTFILVVALFLEVIVSQ